jgi:hypothetical protein
MVSAQIARGICNLFANLFYARIFPSPSLLRAFYKAKAPPFGGAVEHVCETERVYPFRGTKPTRSLTTSPPMMRPATDGTKALEPGTERRMVHLRWVPGGQMQ